MSGSASCGGAGAAAVSAELTAPMVYTDRMLACLYDIHGNLPALEAVLADARREARALRARRRLRAVRRLAAETVARLRELEPALWIRGNGERWTATRPHAPDNPLVQGALAASGRRSATS